MIDTRDKLVFEVFELFLARVCQANVAQLTLGAAETASGGEQERAGGDL